jgi:hypothetical protein
MSILTEIVIMVLLALVVSLVLRKILLMHFDAKDNANDEESPTQLLRSTEIDLIEKKQKSKKATDKTIPELKKQLKEIKKIKNKS